MSIEPAHKHPHPQEPSQPAAQGHDPVAQPALPPHVAMFQIMNGMWVSQIASAVAQLGVADFIAAGTRHAGRLADECGADADALVRLMRAAAASDSAVKP